MRRMGLQKSFERGANYNDFYANQKVNSFEIRMDHMAKIDLDEKGTEAAAVTVFRGRGRSKSRQHPEVINFICDHPFVFLIHDQKLKEILFMGIFRGPNK